MLPRRFLQRGVLVCPFLGAAAGTRGPAAATCCSLPYRTCTTTTTIPSSNNAPAASSFAYAPLVSGNADSGVRDAHEGMCNLTDVMASSAPASVGVDRRVTGGDMLWMIDICAARAATKHVLGHFVATGTPRFDHSHTAQKHSPAPAMDDASQPMAPSSGTLSSSPPKPKPAPPQLSTATVAMDAVVFRHPVASGDVVTMEGTVVCCGSTSLAVDVRVSRIQFPTRVKQFVANATVFMVAIDRNTMKPAKGAVPAVRLSSPSHISQHYEATAAKDSHRLRDEEMGRIRQSVDFDLDTLLDEVNKKKKFHVPMKDTIMTASRMYFQGELNVNDTVFGGEILKWMETHAAECGRFFARNRRVVTLGVHSLEFRHPIYHTDWVSLTSRVVYVRHSTLEVDVEVSVERKGGVTTVTNVASFILVSLDEASRPLEIDCGIALRKPTDLPGTPQFDEDIECVRRYACAKFRYDWSREHRRYCLR